MPVTPAPQQCEAILHAAGIDESLVSLVIVPVPGYSVNVVCILNDRYVLRASSGDAGERFERERRTLERLQDLDVVPRVLGSGSFELGEPAHYMLQTRLPGDTVVARWPGASGATRHRLIAELAEAIGSVHQRPAPAYVIGHYQSALRGWTGSWLDGHDRYVAWLLEAVRRRALTSGQAALVDMAETFYGEHRAALAHSVGPRMMHGDLHLHNVLAEAGRITGIIDWEWSWGGGVEPDFDLEALFRWSLYPRDLGDEDEAARLEAEDFRLVIPTLLAAYPEVRTIPRLMERMTIYQIEHELHQMVSWPARVPTRPVERLRNWVQERRLIRELGAS